MILCYIRNGKVVPVEFDWFASGDDNYEISSTKWISWNGKLCTIQNKRKETSKDDWVSSVYGKESCFEEAFKLLRRLGVYSERKIICSRQVVVPKVANWTDRFMSKIETFSAEWEIPGSLLSLIVLSPFWPNFIFTHEKEGTKFSSFCFVSFFFLKKFVLLSIVVLALLDGQRFRAWECRPAVRAWSHLPLSYWVFSSIDRVIGSRLASAFLEASPNNEIRYRCQA